MNFKILKELIVMLKTKLKCKSCKKNISNREIFIESITNTKVKFKCVCSKCQAVLVTDVALIANEKGEKINSSRSHGGLKLKTVNIAKITPNDILDVKNFLKGFKGDFKEIFRK
jgi:hypothetical protein